MSCLKQHSSFHIEFTPVGSTCVNTFLVVHSINKNKSKRVSLTLRRCLLGIIYVVNQLGIGIRWEITSENVSISD
jgi:hypothetical protein